MCPFTAFIVLFQAWFCRPHHKGLPNAYVWVMLVSPPWLISQVVGFYCRENHYAVVACQMGWAPGAVSVAELGRVQESHCPGVCGHRVSLGLLPTGPKITMALAYPFPCGAWGLKPMEVMCVWCSGPERPRCTLVLDLRPSGASGPFTQNKSKVSCLSGALGPMTGDQHLGVTLTSRQPIVLARLSKDPDRSPELAPKHPSGLCKRPG